MGRKRIGGGNEERRIDINDQQVRDWFNAGMTAAEMAQLIGCSTYPIKSALKRLDLRRPAKRRLGIGSGMNNPQWKGGRRIRTDGYVMIWTQSGERLEHQVVMEQHIGRALKRGEIVHHRNGDKQDNTIENLELMSQSEHAKLHAPDMHAARYRK